MNGIQIPFDTQLEEHIIGCLIYDPACIADALEIIKPAYFYNRRYAELVEKIYSLWTEDEKSVDLMTLAPTLEKLQLSLSKIMDIISSIATTANVRIYGERLRDIAALRYAVKVGQQLMASCSLRDADEIKKAIVTAEGQLSRITEATIQVDTISTLKDALLQFHEDFEQAYYSNETGITGLETGFHDLDSITAGLQKSDLIIVAARPSVGKTAFALQLANNISVKKKEPGALFSLEMSKKSLIRRMVANEALIDLKRLNSGLIEPEEWDKYTMALGILGDGNLVIDDQGGMTVAEIKAKCRRIKRQSGLSYVMIDYLGLIQGERGMSRYDLVSENVRQLKNLAKEFDVPVICLCQLSRDVEKRADKRPVMADLRESGEIEQTADIIAFLHRDDYYDKESEKKNIIEVIIAKQRNGPVGTVELAFLKQFNRMVNLDRGNGA